MPCEDVIGNFEGLLWAFYRGFSEGALSTNEGAVSASRSKPPVSSTQEGPTNYEAGIFGKASDLTSL